jgi:predicted alpha/beta hydrolase
VGHSLGGHAALAAQGIGVLRADAIVGIAAGPPFLRATEPSRRRWIAKRAAFASMLAIARRVGRFPARVLRLGSDDESIACCEDFDRFARTDLWGSRDGRHDYTSALADVHVPVLQVLSEGDRFECVPECGERFVAPCRGPREIMRITSAAGGPPPSHMGLVTSSRSRGAWADVEAWMRRAVAISRTGVRPGSGRFSPD